MADPGGIGFAFHGVKRLHGARRLKINKNVKKDFRKTRAFLLGITRSAFVLNDLIFLEIFVWIFV